MQKSESFLENETHKIFWDFEKNGSPNPAKKTKSSAK